MQLYVSTYQARVYMSDTIPSFHCFLCFWLEYTSILSVPFTSLRPTIMQKLPFFPRRDGQVELGPHYIKFLRFMVGLSQAPAQAHRKFSICDIAWFSLRLSQMDYKKRSYHITTLTCDFISIYNRPITDIVTSVNMTECKYRDCCLFIVYFYF